MNFKCLNVSCENTVPAADRRQWSGCCSRECQLVVTRVYGNTSPALSAHTPTPRKALYARQNARQNWKGSAHDDR